MQAFSESAEFDSVEEGFDEMLLRGLVPDVDVYNVYIGALCRKGDLAGARRMMTCMEHVGCPPDIRTFGVVVAVCMSAGDMSTVRELAQEAIRRGLRWDPPALSELIGLLQADPFSMAPPKALETIGKTLHSQYERWQPKARYKLQLDPTLEEVKKLCNTCRKFARTERVLFHYNGHGVPKPTANGEIWVFNKSYTQYIPLPITDLDSWLKTPSIYVFDCSAAGMIVKAFLEIVEVESDNDDFLSVSIVRL
uniref:Raptor N-terminal CASPase-like domain-containing protein n=1 Tax=Oryza meridionalis TaxID=40149 RepID=A0A0E0BYN2_9ORYZ